MKHIYRLLLAAFSYLFITQLPWSPINVLSDSTSRTGIYTSTQLVTDKRTSQQAYFLLLTFIRCLVLNSSVGTQVCRGWDMKLIHPFQSWMAYMNGGTVSLTLEAVDTKLLLSNILLDDGTAFRCSFIGKKGGPCPSWINSHRPDVCGQGSGFKCSFN